MDDVRKPYEPPQVSEAKPLTVEALELLDDDALRALLPELEATASPLRHHVRRRLNYQDPEPEAEPQQ